jgi:hypothetical protein
LFIVCSRQCRAPLTGTPNLLGNALFRKLWLVFSDQMCYRYCHVGMLRPAPGGVAGFLLRGGDRCYSLLKSLF